MTIKFKKVHIHHFMSIGDAEVNLNDRGYCLVEGVNRNPKDAAKSNGSGKSTIFNAICYALVGETTNGLKSNLGNIVFNDGCWVELEFDADGKSYKLLRSTQDKKLGSDLKITEDNVDKSGKTLRESQAILNELLPDLTSNLVGSVILLGQGLPQKFTNNTPSGRKEVLESLSKSDFMIADVKERLNKRLSAVNNEYRKYEDEILRASSQIEILEEQQRKNNEDLEKYKVMPDFDSEISKIDKDIEKFEAERKKTQESMTSYREIRKTSSDALNDVSKSKQELIDKCNNTHNEQYQEDSAELNKLNADILSLQQEINRLDSITDVCPTCGQKIPNVFKVDTTSHKEKLKTLTEQRDELKRFMSEDNDNYRKSLSSIDAKFDNEVKTLREKINDADTHLNNSEGYLTGISSKLQELGFNKLNITNKKSSFLSDKERISKSITETQNKIDTLSKERLYNNNEKSLLDKHLSVLNGMNTLIKRDFRGFLLTNVINYISERAKEYATQIFNTDDLVFALDGNNIDITFCGKDFDNLSGGEKQRVDLIIQFAIRDMMCNYLDFSSNILVLDEITDALDSVSCDKVLSFITNNLNVESVFIISHHSEELEIAYDDKITIEKNEEGISEVV